MHYCSPSHVLSYQKDTRLTKYQLYQQVTHHFLHALDHFQYDLKSSESLLQRNMDLVEVLSFDESCLHDYSVLTDYRFLQFDEIAKRLPYIQEYLISYPIQPLFHVGL